MITLQMTKNWNIMPIVVYKYMDKKYADEFMELGKIRLFPLAYYKKLECDERGDKEEGHSSRVIVNKTGEGMTMVAETRIGENSLVFCTSLVYSEHLKEKFGGAVIRINDTHSFGLELSNCVPDLSEGLEGPCVYEDRKSVAFEDFKYPDDFYLPNSKIIDGDKMKALSKKAMDPVEVFRKPASYTHQAEYRIVWFLNHKPIGALDITNTDLIKYCTRIA